MPEPKLAAVPKPRFRYEPMLSEVEHRAYAAAYRIIDAPARPSHFSRKGEDDTPACPSAQRRWRVDQLARIIAQEWGEEIRK